MGNAIKRPLALLLLTAALLAFGGPCLAVDPHKPGAAIIVGGDRDYPPYEFLDKDGQPAGYNVDLTRAIAEVMGMKVEFRLGTWSDMRQALMDGGVDILQGMSYSEYRLLEVDFAPPHTIVNHAVFARQGATAVTSLDDLRGRRVVVHRGGIMNDTLAARGGADSLLLTDTPADALRLLASGEGDYAVVAMLPGIYIIRENRLDNLEIAARRVATVRYCYAVKKGNAELLARFSEGLAILKQTGQYEEIHNRWLGVLEQAPLRWETVARYAAVVVLPLVLLLLGSVFWSHTLRKQVAQRTRSLSDALDALGAHQQQLVQADKMAALGILVSGVAHEVNNPNGLMLLNIPILKKAHADAARILDEHFQAHGDFTLGGISYARMRLEIPQMLDEMQDGAQKIKRIVNDLKDFARPGDAADKEPVDVNAAAKKALRLVDATIRKATDHFSADFAPDLPPVWGNAQRIEQVVVNLVLNACQALAGPDRAITLSTRNAPGAGTVVLSLRDEGTGIKPEHLPHLTDPFFTTKRDSGGTGLGLSVSAGIVKEHGGSLVFDSAKGTGTTVTLTLPAARQEPAS